MYIALFKSSRTYNYAHLSVFFFAVFVIKIIMLLFRMSSTQNRLMGSLSGGLAGACQIIITTPMELLKIQQQDQGRTGTRTRRAFCPSSFEFCCIDYIAVYFIHFAYIFVPLLHQLLRFILVLKA